MVVNWQQFFNLSENYLEDLIKALAEADRDVETACKLFKEGTKRRKFLIGENVVWKKQLKEIICNMKREKKVRPAETMRACHGGMVGRQNVAGFVKDLMDYELAIHLRHAKLPGRPEVVDVVMQAEDLEKIRFV